MMTTLGASGKGVTGRAFRWGGRCRGCGCKQEGRGGHPTLHVDDPPHAPTIPPPRTQNCRRKKKAPVNKLKKYSNLLLAIFLVVTGAGWWFTHSHRKQLHGELDRTGEHLTRAQHQLLEKSHHLSTKEREIDELKRRLERLQGEMTNTHEAVSACHTAERSGPRSLRAPRRLLHAPQAAPLLPGAPPCCSTCPCKPGSLTT